MNACVVPPANGVAPLSILGKKKTINNNPQIKDYIIIGACFKYPWLHCQDVGSVQNNITRGLITINKVRSKLTMSKPIPNHTPMHLK